MSAGDFVRGADALLNVVSPLVPGRAHFVPVDEALRSEEGGGGPADEATSPTDRSVTQRVGKRIKNGPNRPQAAS
jgi:hypothetical protein